MDELIDELVVAFQQICWMNQKTDFLTKERANAEMDE